MGAIPSFVVSVGRAFINVIAGSTFAQNVAGLTSTSKLARWCVFARPVHLIAVVSACAAFVDICASGSVIKSIACKSGITSTREKHNWVFFARSIRDAIVRVFGTLVNLNAAKSGSRVTRATRTRETTVFVDALCWRLAVVCPTDTLVDIRAANAVAIPPIVARAGEAARVVRASSMSVAIVSRNVAFVNV